MELLQKKKENQEKGNYESMRKNKKNIKSPGESSLMQLKFKKYDIYTDPKHGSLSIDRFKKL